MKRTQRMDYSTAIFVDLLKNIHQIFGLILNQNTIPQDTHVQCVGKCSNCETQYDVTLKNVPF